MIKEYFTSKTFSNTVLIGNHEGPLKYFLLVVNFHAFLVTAVFLDKTTKLTA